MRIVIRLSAREEIKALPILLRHSTGMVLPNSTYVISGEAAQALRDAGVRFSEISSEAAAPHVREPRPVKEYDVFVPLYYNDGTPIEPRKFRDLHRRLLDHFDGLTFFPQPNEGFWRLENVVYRDEIVIYRVLTSKPRSARRFLLRLKAELKREFQQEEILIVERDVDTL